MYPPLDETGIEAVLEKNHLGHLGCTMDATTYVFPMAYVYHDNVIYGQTTTGQKTNIARTNSKICFQVEEVQGKAWRSVMCWGDFEELDFQELRNTQLQKMTQLLTKRIAEFQHLYGVIVPYSIDTNETIPVTVNDKTSTLFRIVVDKKTGRSHTWQ